MLYANSNANWSSVRSHQKLHASKYLSGTFYFTLFAHSQQWLAVWLSGNALASINVVALRQTRLVPGWVTVCGRVNHVGM